MSVAAGTLRIAEITDARRAFSCARPRVTVEGLHSAGVSQAAGKDRSEGASAC